MNVLILASNPRKDLNLDREIWELTQVINASRNHREFQVEDTLVFEGNNGGEQWVRTAAIADLFRLFAKDVGWMGRVQRMGDYC